MTTTTPTQSLSSRPLRTSIEAELIQMLASPINPDRSNSGKTLWMIYFWQVVADLAAARSKASWEEAQKPGGLVDPDDDLRALSPGEHIAAESNKFSALVKVAKPRRNLDVEKFVQEAARKWRVDAAKVEALLDKCKTTGKASLTKRIIELEN